MQQHNYNVDFFLFFILVCSRFFSWTPLNFTSYTDSSIYKVPALQIICRRWLGASRVEWWVHDGTGKRPANGMGFPSPGVKFWNVGSAREAKLFSSENVLGCFCLGPPYEHCRHERRPQLRTRLSHSKGLYCCLTGASSYRFSCSLHLHAQTVHGLILQNIHISCSWRTALRSWSGYHSL